jgi:hypothetical protein
MTCRKADGTIDDIDAVTLILEGHVESEEAEDMVGEYVTEALSSSLIAMTLGE